jgi:CBS-domain-containing membrane protein
MFRRFDLKTEVALATVPVAMIIAVLMLLETFSKQQLVFSPLASSAFLIYLDPRHPTNSTRTLIIAQASTAIIGYVAYLIAGSGYLSAAISMIIAVSVVLLTKAMHPPAVSSALIFAFQYTKPNTLMLFLFALLLLVITIVLQRISIWIIKKKERKAHEK